MKSRIEYIIGSESLSNLQFAQSLNISPASITHILSGRNNPSLDIVTRIARKYPHYNLRWLLLGEGAISNLGEAQNFNDKSPSLFSSNNNSEQEDNDPLLNSEPKSSSLGLQCIPEQKLIVCLPDGTYKEYIKQ